MRFSAITLFSLVAASAASTISRRQFPGFPDCSQACLVSADTAGCKQGDQTCLCNSDAFVNSTFECINKSCSSNQKDLANAIEGAYQLCLAVQVTLTAAKSAEASALSAAAATEAATTSAPSGSSAAPSATPSGAAAPRAAGNTAALGLVGIAAIAFAL